MATANVFNTVPKFTGTQPLKDGQLDQKSIEKFFNDGFLMVPNFFDIEHDLEPCKKAIEGMVDHVAQKLFKAGKIENLHENSDLFHRLTLINRDFPGSTVLMHKIGHMPDAMMKLWTNEKLLNVMEQLIGPELGGHPVWNIRPKAPLEQNHDVPWHQDNGYLDQSAENVLQVTAWIPLTDANETNGCLEVLKGGHKTGKLAPHLGCWADTWYIYMDPNKIEETLGVSPDLDRVTVPVPYGGMLLFSNALPHRSLPNQSDEIRWSFDFRWQNPNQSYGFHGVKDGVVFRSKNQQRLNPEDWKKFISVDRHDTTQITNSIVGKINWHASDEDEDIDTTMVPFFMYRWPLVHENKHTARLLRSV